MKAIILAAGESRRLRPLTLETPKCLLVVGSKRIIDYQLEALERYGVRSIIMVVGYRAEQIMRGVTETYHNLDFTFLYNPKYSETNTLYSLWLARKFMTEDFLYFNADVVVHPDIIKRLINSQHDTTHAVNTARCAEEEVKVIVDKATGTLLHIGKKLDPEKCLGESIGIAKYSAAYSKHLHDELERGVRQREVMEYFELAVERTLPVYPVHYTDVSDLPCIEVDFPEDLENAKKLAQQLL